MSEKHALMPLSHTGTTAQSADKLALIQTPTMVQHLPDKHPKLVAAGRNTSIVHRNSSYLAVVGNLINQLVREIAGVGV